MKIKEIKEKGIVERVWVGVGLFLVTSTDAWDLVAGMCGSRAKS